MYGGVAVLPSTIVFQPHTSPRPAMSNTMHVTFSVVGRGDAEFDSTSQGADSPAKVDFARDIQPLFEKHCYACHGPKKQEAGFRLDERAAALAGGDMGRDIVPGKSGDSLLFSALVGTTEAVSRMPAKGDPLSAAEIQLVKDWIDQGAGWPETAREVKKDPRTHWAFRAPVRPAIPEVKNSSWVANDIDRFVLPGPNRWARPPTRLTRRRSAAAQPDLIDPPPRSPR
jgi:mono/diheme cytochrome c family protein